MTAASSTLNGATVLVVGGAGFVGSNLVCELLSYDVKRVIIVDNFLSSDSMNVPDDRRIELIARSIVDGAVLATLPDTLDFAWHLACFHGNQSSIADPVRDHDNNLLTSLKLFDRLKSVRSLKKVVYSAAGCAFGAKTFGEASATSEDSAVSMYHDSPYSISKLVGELYGNYFFKQNTLPFVTARFQNVYGPGETLGAGEWRGTPHTVWRNVTPTFIFRALHGESLPLENGGDASRDFIFVGDIVRGLIACAVHGEPGQAYNLASGVETTILEWANLINELTGNRALHEIKPRRDWDRSGKRFGDTAKSRDLLGFEAKVSARDGVEKTIAWTRANLNEIKRCMLQHADLVPDVRRYA